MPQTEDQRVFEIVQKRMDDYARWVSGGCVGPDPCANCANPPFTYGDPRLKDERK